MPDARLQRTREAYAHFVYPEWLSEETRERMRDFHKRFATPAFRALTGKEPEASQYRANLKAAREA